MKSVGHEDSGILETPHLTFCKIVLSLTKNIPSCMINEELGRTLIGFKIKVKVLSSWFELK